MVVDDEHEIEQMMESQLEKSGYEHVSFHETVAAMEFFKENYSGIDLAILDLTMPGMGGDEMARQMCQLAPDLPILLMTGHLETRDADDNVSKVLHKPILKEELLEAIEGLIGTLKTDN